MKRTTPLSTPGVATCSMTSRDDDDQRSRSGSRSGFEDDWDRMDVDEVGGSSRQKLHKMRSSRRSRKLTQRRSPSTSSKEWMVDQAAVSEQGTKGADALDQPTGTSSL